MTADYNLIGLPRQPDQHTRWFVPNDATAPYSESVEDVQGLDGAVGEFGGINFSWVFTYLSPLQIQYLRDTFFDGGRYTDAITVMTWDRAYGWRVVNCQARMLNPAKEAQAPDAWAGYDQLRIDFYNGAIASSGFELLLEDGDVLLLENGDILNVES